MRITWVGAIVVVAMALPLSGCAMGSDRERSISRCERTAGRQPGLDAVAARSMCECMIDRLAEEGMTILDTLGSNRERAVEITRSCRGAGQFGSYGR